MSDTSRDFRVRLAIVAIGSGLLLCWAYVGSTLEYSFVPKRWLPRLSMAEFGLSTLINVVFLVILAPVILRGSWGYRVLGCLIGLIPLVSLLIHVLLLHHFVS